MVGRGGWKCQQHLGSPLDGRTQLCRASSAHPRPTPAPSQPLPSNAISQAAVFVTVSFHQENLTIPGPGLAVHEKEKREGEG